MKIVIHFFQNLFDYIFQKSSTLFKRQIFCNIINVFNVVAVYNHYISFFFPFIFLFLFKDSNMHMHAPPTPPTHTHTHPTHTRTHTRTHAHTQTHAHTHTHTHTHTEGRSHSFLLQVSWGGLSVPVQFKLRGFHPLPSSLSSLSLLIN